VTTILIVEDEPSIAQIMCIVLEREGYNVMTATNGQEGLDQLTQERPDLVISDVMMPFLTGVQMYSIMQADPALRDIPVVFMSAAGAEPGLSSVPNYSGLLWKPFDLSVLLYAVSKAIGLPEHE
jgi:CheY-like chemotaxis protein